VGIIKNVFGKKEEKTDDDLKAAVLKKATENWNAKSESSFIDEGVVVISDPADIEENKKQNIQTVLLELAERGETGVLATSISDKTGLTNVDTTTALSYLIENKYAEAINSPTGVKYYLTEAGRTK
jgi:hypothetical protein